MMDENRASWVLGHLLHKYCKLTLFCDPDRRPLHIFRYWER